MRDLLKRSMAMPINANPYQHQVLAYEFALRKFRQRKGVAYLMEMGTGKTITTIAVVGTLAHEGKVNKALVVAPKTIVTVWHDEFERFSNFDYSLAVMDGATNKKADTLRNMKGELLQIAVINYESAWRMEKELAEWKPDIIICDESTKIKNPQAKCSKCMHRLGKKSRYNMILTGTPIVNNPLDFFSQYKFLDDSVFGGSYYPFRARYAILGGYQKHQVVGYCHLDELTEKAHNIAYRVKLSDAVDLPPYIDDTRLIELEPKAMSVYRNVERDSYAELMNGELTAKNILTKLLRLSQITGGFVRNDTDEEAQKISSAKLETFEDILDTCLDEGKKVVVFARFVPEITALERLVRKKGIDYACIYGAVKNRAEQVDKFQNDEKCKVFIGQLQTVGMGLTLTAASVAVFYSLDFNYANYEQSRARIHRIGQNEKCQYIHLVAKGTVDEKIMYALKHKGDIARIIVDEWRLLKNG